MKTNLKVSLAVVAAIGAAGGLAWATSYTSAAFDQHDTRFFTGSNEGVDWDVGALKGECGINTKVMGISATAIGMRPDLRAHSILCGDWTAIGFNGDRLHRGDNEQMRRIAYRDDRGDFSTGDWDPGFIKAECKYDESVTGVSQNGPLSSLRMSRVLCSTSRDFNAAIVSDCHTLVFSHVSDNRLTTVSGDWAPGYSKNECGERQYVKGVSSTGTGEIHAILCCGFSIRID